MKKIALLSNGLILDDPSPRLVKEILARYTVANPDFIAATRFSPSGYVSASIPETICYAGWDGDRLTIPRGFSPEKASTFTQKELAARKIKDVRNFSTEKFPPLQIAPNNDQKKLFAGFQKALRENLRPHGSFLFVASTSTGKTIFQAMTAAELGQRALVLCATNLIRNAWQRDLNKAFGIETRDLGIIQQSKWALGKHFTLASMATLQRRKARWPELFSKIGTIIVDEVQILSEPRVLEFLTACTSAYIVGASATPHRESGVNHALKAIMGEPVTALKTSLVKTSTSMPLKKVRVIETDFRYSYDSKNLDLHDLALSLAADEERNSLIVREALSDWKMGHSVLITVHRVAHLHLLSELLRKKGIPDVNVMHGETNSDKYYTEALIKATLARKCRMLVATAQAVKLGGNLNPLTRLHLAWPVNSSDLTQLIGRIRRRAKGKQDIEAIYYLDRKVRWLLRRYIDKAIPVFREMEVSGFREMWIA